MSSFTSPVTRVRCGSSVLFVLASLAGCGSTALPGPDAAPPSTVPTSPAGRFAVTSTFDLPVPPAAGAVLAALAAATDGPDDPTRYLVDRMIATLPDGTVKTIAGGAAPYVAAYLNERLASIAPRFVTGIAAISDGLARVASHVGTIETLQIDGSGAAIRTITAARFDVAAQPVIAGFAEAGLADIVVGTHVALDAAGHVSIADHAHGVPYGALLRLGLDRAVIAGVEPTARDLAAALAALVDCTALGVLVADRIGLGSPALYRTACRAAMTAIASELYARIDAIDDAPVALELTGGADGVDLDGDGTLDELRAGRWSGALSSATTHAPIEAARFTGTKAP
jgi:hypothetical protein